MLIPDQGRRPSKTICMMGTPIHNMETLVRVPAERNIIVVQPVYTYYEALRDPICWYFPKTLIRAAVESLGVGIPNLYSVQGISHLKSMAMHIVGWSITGLLI
jgi:hypothetical protein